MTRILVTGGGTGGHVQPALAVVAELRARRPDIELLYVGSALGIEARLAREAGVEFRAVSVGKLRRSSRGVAGLLTAKNAVDAMRVPVGVVQSISAVRSFRPDAVLGTGGFVSVPTIVAAGLLKVPVLTHEQTVTIGLANRLAGRFATRIAVSFESSIAELPARLRARAFVTGNPVRKECFGGDRLRAVGRFGFDHADDGLPCVYVTGGVQGSRKVNHAVRDSLAALLAGARVLHQCGSADAQELSNVRGMLGDGVRGRYAVCAFVEQDEIGDAYALADVVVGRSGAGTVAELAALRMPSVLVPLEPSAGHEQLRNAQRLVDVGGAVIVRQADLSGATLAEAVGPLLADRSRRVGMGERLAPLATPNAAADLACALLELADR